MSILNQKVTHLLLALQKDCKPNRNKFNQLRRILQSEFPNRPVQTIEKQILSYYNINFDRRTESAFSQNFSIKKQTWLQNQFLLDFKKSYLNETLIYNSSVELNHLLTKSIDAPFEIMDSKIIHVVLYKLTHPRWDEPSANLDLYDVLRKWSEICFSRFGNKYESIFKQLELLLTGKALDSSLLKTSSELQTEKDPLFLTATEITWIEDVLKCMARSKPLPDYPIAQGPQNKYTRALSNLVRDWNHEVAKARGNLKELESSTLRRVTASVAFRLLKTTKHSNITNLKAA